MSRNDLITIQPYLQKLVEIEMPMDEAYQVMRLIDRINPVLRDEKIEGIGIDKIEITLSHDIKMTPTDLKFLSELINFKEVVH